LWYNLRCDISSGYSWEKTIKVRYGKDTFLLYFYFFLLRLFADAYH
jgi:hypothetical protein